MHDEDKDSTTAGAKFSTYCYFTFRTVLARNCLGFVMESRVLWRLYFNPVLLNIFWPMDRSKNTL